MSESEQLFNHFPFIKLKQFKFQMKNKDLTLKKKKVIIRRKAEKE